MHQVILLEGLDRTGKTTVARGLANHFQIPYIHCPPEEIARFREFFDKNASDEDSFAFYWVGNLIVDAQVSELREATPLIVERWYPSTIASHGAKSRRDLSYLAERITNQPQKIFYLTGDIDELLARSAKTENPNPRFSGKEHWREVDANYRRLFQGDPRVTEIDTTHISIEDTYEQIKEEIAQLLR